MMEKKRSVGVTLTVTMKLLWVIFGLFWTWVLYILAFYDTATPQPPLGARLLMIFVSLYFAIYIIDTIYLFKLRNWSRKLSLNLDIIGILLMSWFFLIRIPDAIIVGIEFRMWGDLLEGITHSLLIVIPIYFLFFFTRPKVKEQFK